LTKIIHNRNKCIGCNSCVEHSPDDWVINDEDGKSDLIGATKKGDVYIKEITPADLEVNKRAARDCPSRIIHVKE
jgi:ferredoxin